MAAPVTVDLSESYGYAGGAPVGVNLSATAYVGDAPVSRDFAAEAPAGDAPVSVEIPGGGESALFFPQTVNLYGTRNGADHANVVHYGGQVVHYNGTPATT